jgi:hypothetical protein
MMRKKKPIPAVIDQVRITRDGNDAIIEYADPTISDTRLAIGPQIKKMTDRDIVDVFNGVMAAQAKLLADWDRTVAEVPPGRPQIEYHRESDQWIPRGEVLRCIVDDGGPEGEVTIHIDDKEFSPAEFAQLLKFYAGWGMRIAFVPEELVTENPKIVVREPKKVRRR